MARILRGEIRWADLSPTRGRETGLKTRRARRMNFRLSRHAKEELARRRIPAQVLEDIKGSTIQLTHSLARHCEEPFCGDEAIAWLARPGTGLLRRRPWRLAMTGGVACQHYSAPINMLKNPQQIVSEYGGKKCYQSQLDFGGGRMHLLRAIVIENVDPAVVVTVYKTSKIGKYWRRS